MESLNLDSILNVNVLKDEHNGKPIYELGFSRANFDYLFQGEGPVSGKADNGLQFRIYKEYFSKRPQTFNFNPSQNAYSIQIGVNPKFVPEGATEEQVESSSQEYYEDLEKLINESGKIPMQIWEKGHKIDIGYVVMNVEKSN